MIWRFHPEAADELLEACAYYSEISPRLGRSFHAGIEKAIEQVLHTPRACPIVEDDIRRCLVRRYPYGLYYTLIEEDSVVLILAILHLRRKPGAWRGRLL